MASEHYERYRASLVHYSRQHDEGGQAFEVATVAGDQPNTVGNGGRRYPCIVAVISLPERMAVRNGPRGGDGVCVDDGLVVGQNRHGVDPRLERRALQFAPTGLQLLVTARRP
jgi:hypothetical protein